MCAILLRINMIIPTNRSRNLLHSFDLLHFAQDAVSTLILLISLNLVVIESSGVISYMVKLISLNFLIFLNLHFSEGGGILIFSNTKHVFFTVVERAEVVVEP